MTCFPYSTPYSLYTCSSPPTPSPVPLYFVPSLYFLTCHSRLTKPVPHTGKQHDSHQWGQNTAHHGSHSQTGEPRTGIVSRVKIQLSTEATHQLESQGQALSAGSKSSSPTDATPSRETQGQSLSAGRIPAHHRSHSPTGEPKTGVISRVKIQLTKKATHFLKSQGQALSAGLKSSSLQKPLTFWRAKDRHGQQGQNPAHHRSHSLAGEPRTCVISRVKIQLTTEATHKLESQGQVS